MQRNSKEQFSNLQELQQQLREIEDNDPELLACSRLLKVKAVILEVLHDYKFEDKELLQLEKEFDWEVRVLKQQKRTILEKYDTINLEELEKELPLEYLSSSFLLHLQYILEQEAETIDEAVAIYQTEQFRLIRLEIEKTSPKNVEEVEKRLMQDK